MKSNRRLAWELYNTQDSLNSNQMKEIVDSLPCDQGIKTTIYESLLLSENFVIDKLEEEVIPLMYLEEMAKDLDIDHNKKYQTGGSYRSKMKSKVVKNFFNKHLRIELDDKSIDDIIEAELEMNDEYSNDQYDLDVEKARQEIDLIEQKGGKDKIEENEYKSLWMCPECKFPSNSCEKLMCIKCEALNPNPPKDDYQKWKENYPNTVKLVSKSMAGFLFVFKRIINQLKANSGGKMNDDNMGYINNLMFSMEPDNILRMIHKRGIQLKEIFLACRDFITNFMVKSFVKLKEIIFWVFDKIIHIFNFTKDKVETFLYPKTYLTNKKRVNRILDNIDLRKNPEMYNIRTTLDEIMEIDVEFLERSIDKWIERGPDTPVRAILLNSIESADAAVAAAAVNISGLVLHYLGITGTKDSLNEEQLEQMKLREIQERMVYEYLTKLYNYLVTSNFFIENGPDISKKSSSIKYRMTIYFFNVLLIFRRRWRFGHRPDDIRIFDGKKSSHQKKSDRRSFSENEEVYVTQVKATLKYPEFIMGESGFFRSTEDHHSMYTHEFTWSDNLFKGVVKHVVPGGLPGGMQLPGGKKCYGDYNKWDECAQTDYYVEYKIPLDSIREGILDFLTGILIDNNQGSETATQYRKKLSDYIESIALTDEEGDKYILVNSGNPEDNEYSGSSGDVPNTPEIIFNSKFQGEDSALERMLSSDFSNNNKLCHDDPHAGENPYPDDGDCPYEEDSPPIKNGKEWINWIKSSNARTFVENKLPKSLFFHELLDNRTDDLGNIVKDTVPKNCDQIKIRYDDKFINIDDNVTVKDITAVPIEVSKKLGGIQHAFKQVEPKYLFTGREKRATILDVLMRTEDSEYLSLDKLGKTIDDVTKLSSRDYIKNVKYVVKFLVDVDDLDISQISYNPSHVKGEDEYYNGYVEYIQYVLPNNFQSIDENYTSFEMKQVIYSYLCEHTDDIEKLNINILKSILLLDYEAINEYDSYKVQEGGAKLEEQLYFSLDKNGEIFALSHSKSKVATINREILYQNMLGGDSDKCCKRRGSNIPEKHENECPRGLIELSPVKCSYKCCKKRTSKKPGKFIKECPRGMIEMEMDEKCASLDDPEGGGDGDNDEDDDEENEEITTVNEQLGDKQVKLLEDKTSGVDNKPTQLEAASEKTKELYKQAMKEMSSERSFSEWFSKTDLGKNLLNPSSKTIIEKTTYPFKISLGYVLKGLFFIVYAFYAGIKFGVVEIAKAAWKLMSSNGTVLLLSMKLWEGLLDYVCDELGNMWAHIKNTALDSAGDGYIGNAFKAMGIRSDSARKRDVQEKEGKSKSLTDMIEDNLLEIQSYWNHFNRIGRRNSMANSLGNIYDIRPDYNHSRWDPRDSSSAPIFINQLEIDQLISIPKSRSTMGNMIFGNGDDPIEILEKMKLSTVPGQVTGKLAGLFKPDFEKAFRNLLNLKSEQAELTKKISAKDIYPHLAQIVGIEESKIKPGFSYSGGNKKSIQVRARGAFIFLIEQIFRFKSEGHPKYDYSTSNIGTSVPLEQRDARIFLKSYDVKLGEFFDRACQKQEHIDKFAVYNIALEFIDNLSRISEQEYRSDNKMFTKKFKDNFPTYQDFLKELCNKLEFSDYGEQLTGRGENPCSDHSEYKYLIRKEIGKALKLDGTDILKTRVERKVVAAKRTQTKVKETAPLGPQQSIVEEVDFEGWDYESAKSLKSEKLVSFLVNEELIGAVDTGVSVDKDTPYITYKVKVIIPDEYKNSDTEEYDSFPIMNDHTELVSLNQLGFVQLFTDTSDSIELGRDNNPISLDNIVKVKVEKNADGNLQINQEYLLDNFYNKSVQLPDFNKNFKYSSNGTDFDLQLIKTSDNFNFSQTEATGLLDQSLIKKDIEDNINKALFIDQIQLLREGLGRALDWNKKDSVPSDKRINLELIQKASTRLSDHEQLQGKARLDSTELKDLIPKVGDIVYVNYPQKFTNKSKLYKSEGIFSTADKSYSKDTTLYDLLEAVDKMKNTLQDNENKIASDKYYVKQADDRKARLEGISNHEREWNDTIDEMLEVLKDNFNPETGTFNIDCVANDVCPRFEANPGYFNIMYVLKGIVPIVKIGKGFPENVPNLQSTDLADSRFYFIVEKGSKSINHEVIKMFTDFDIFRLKPWTYMKSHSDYNKIKKEFRFGPKEGKSRLRGAARLDEKDYDLYQVDGNYCDPRLPTMFEYLSVCNVWNRPGNKGPKEPYPIQMTGYKIDCQYHDKLVKMLEDAKLIASGGARWLAHRVVDVALLAAAAPILIAGGPLTLVAGAALAFPEYVSGGVNAIGTSAVSAGKALKTSAQENRKLAKQYWDDKEKNDESYEKRAWSDVGGIAYDTAASAANAAGGLSQDSLGATKDSLGDVLLYMGESTQEMASYIDNGLKYINTTIGNVYTGIHSMLDAVMNTLADMFTGAFSAVTGGFSPQQFIINKIIPMIVNIYKYASGKQEIQLNIFKNKFFNSGGITGGFTNFAANRVGIGRIIESSASVLLSDQVAKGAGLASRRALELPIAAINALPLASTAGGKGAADLVKSFADDAQAATEKFVKKALIFNSFIDGIQTAMRIFSNPCHLMLIGLGIKLPAAAYQNIIEVMSWMFNKNSAIKEIQKKQVLQVKEKIKTKKAKQLEEIAAFKEIEKCEHAKKANLVPTVAVLNDYKKEMAELLNQKLILETSNDITSDRYTDIDKKYRIASDKYFLIANYLPYNCDMLEKDKLDEIAIKYLAAMEYEIPKNNKLILTLLYSTRELGGIVLKFEEDKYGIKLIAKLPHPDEGERKETTIAIPRTKANELIVEIMNESQDKSRFEFNDKYYNFIENSDRFFSEERKKEIRETAQNFYFNTIGEQFITDLFSAGDITKYIKIPITISKWLYDINLFIHQEKATDDIFGNIAEESGFTQIVQSLLLNSQSSVFDISKKKMNIITDNISKFRPIINRVSNNIKQIYFDYNTEYLIQNFEEYSINESVTIIENMYLMLKKIDKLDLIISDSAKMKVFKDELSKKILALRERKVKLDNHESNFDITKTTLDTEISQLENDGLNAINNELPKKSLRDMKEEMDKLNRSMKDIKKLLVYAKDSITMLKNEEVTMEYYDDKISYDNLLDDINFLRQGGEVDPSTNLMKITEEQVCEAKNKKIRTFCMFYDIIVDKFKQYKILPEYILKYIVNIDPANENSFIKRYELAKSKKPTVKFSEMLIGLYSRFVNNTYVPQLKSQISNIEPVLLSAKQKIQTLNDHLIVKRQKLSLIKNHHDGYEENIKSVKNMIKNAEKDKTEFDKNSKFHKGIRSIFKRTFETLKTNRSKFVSDFTDEKEKDCVNKLTTVSLLETYNAKLKGLLDNGTKFDNIKNGLNERYENLRPIFNEVFNFDSLEDIEPTMVEIEELQSVLKDKLSQVGQTKKEEEAKQSRENQWKTSVTSYKSEIARIGGSEDSAVCKAKSVNQEELIKTCPTDRRARLGLYKNIHPDHNAACPKTSNAMFKLIDGGCPSGQEMTGSGIVEDSLKNQQNNKKQIEDDIFVFF